MKKQVVLFSMLLLAIGATAQMPSFDVTRDSLGYLLTQPGQAPTRFDTAFVQQSLREKTNQQTELSREADHIERLLAIRKSLALLNDEKNVLLEILKKAQQCSASPK